jgi:hypothetical protein
MLTPEGAVLASKAVTASSAFFESSRETMGPFLEQAKRDGEVRQDLELDDFIEWTLRLIFSFAMFDSPEARDRTSLRRLIAEFLVPSLTP